MREDGALGLGRVGKMTLSFSSSQAVRVPGSESSNVTAMVENCVFTHNERGITIIGALLNTSQQNVLNTKDSFFPSCARVPLLRAILTRPALWCRSVQAAARCQLDLLPEHRDARRLRHPRAHPETELARHRQLLLHQQHGRKVSQAARLTFH